MDETFGKAYKLCSKKRMDQLFSSGDRFFQFPFQLIALKIAEPHLTPFQVAISVPKRQFKRAVDRNRIKRLIREVIRKNKVSLEALVEGDREHLALFVVYRHQESMEYALMEKKFKGAVKKMESKFIKK